MSDSFDSTTVPTKICTRCKAELPITLEYFYRRPRAKDGLKSECKQCNSRASREYNHSHREGRKAACRRYYQKHKEAHNKSSRERWKKNKSKYSVAKHDNYMRNRTRRREYTSQWKKDNPDKVRSNNQRRRAIRRNVKVVSTQYDEKGQLKRQKGRCYYCNEHMDVYHIEHIIPLSRGGSDDPSNKVLACPKCNLSKHKKLPHEWPEGGRLL